MRACHIWGWMCQGFLMSKPGGEASNERIDVYESGPIGHLIDFFVSYTVEGTRISVTKTAHTVSLCN